MLKKLMKVSMMTLTITFFAFALYIMVFGTIARKNNELLSIFGYSYSAVPTNSMAGENPDSFEAGSFIITKSKKYEDVKLNDVIVFKQDNILVVHRVVLINEDGSFVTKGDNNQSVDQGFVTKDNYQGVVTNSFMFLKLGSKIASYQLIILLFLIVSLIIFAISQLFTIFKLYKEEKLKQFEDNEKERIRQELLQELKGV